VGSQVSSEAGTPFGASIARMTPLCAGLQEPGGSAKKATGLKLTQKQRAMDWLAIHGRVYRLTYAAARGCRAEVQLSQVDELGEGQEAVEGLAAATKKATIESCWHR